MILKATPLSYGNRPEQSITGILFMPHPFSCQCQKLQGVVLEGGTCSRVLCYCKDCQAFARYLRRQSAMLNDQGGTHIVQVAAHRVRFTRGMEHLAVVRLSPRGLLRWYASCCDGTLRI